MSDISEIINEVNYIDVIDYAIDEVSYEVLNDYIRIIKFFIKRK